MNNLKTLQALLSAFGSTTKGSTAIEYALIATLISIAILGGIESLSGGISSMFGSISTAIE
ncbi:MAG: Flp family type IVb pilin [Rhodospirillaceae bacterium]|nr:MAG: Flp family type IVb pilin [Rhodospirillaceae bacterium]